MKTYTTVSTVSSATLLWCLVDLDVLNDQVSGIETLGIGVGLSVLQETEEELGGLDWPSSTGDTELLSYRDISISPSFFRSHCPKFPSGMILPTYLEQHVQFLRRIFSLGQPPCVLERSRGT